MEDKTLRSVDIPPEKAAKIDKWIKRAVGTLLKGRSFTDFDDYVQKAWEIILNKTLEQGQLPEPFSNETTGFPYTFGIAKNVVLPGFRNERRRLSREVPTPIYSDSDDDDSLEPIDNVADTQDDDMSEITDTIADLYKVVKNSNLPDKEKDLRLKWLQFFIHTSGLQDLHLNIKGDTGGDCAKFLGFTGTGHATYKKIKREMEDLVAQYFGRSAEEIRKAVKKQRAEDRARRRGKKIG